MCVFSKIYLTISAVQFWVAPGENSPGGEKRIRVANRKDSGAWWQTPSSLSSFFEYNYQINQLENDLELWQQAPLAVQLLAKQMQPVWLFPGQAVWGVIWKRTLEKSQTNGTDNCVWLWRRAPSTLELPAKRFAWRTAASLSDQLQCDAGPEISELKFYMVLWLVKKWPLASWVRRKMET